MYRDRVVSISVPAFNEEAHIAQVITTMPAFVDHIVVVDDCSTDHTRAYAEAVGDPRAVIVRRETNGGVGASVIDGHRQGLAFGCDISVVMAGDGQMDPTYLASLLDPPIDDGFGFAKANRFYSWRSFNGMPWVRVVGSIVLSFLMKIASGYWRLVDPQNGYTAITRETLERLDLDALATRYEFENDLLIRLNMLGVRATDVPIPAFYGTEVSGMRLSVVAPRISRLMVSGFIARMKAKRRGARGVEEAPSVSSR